MLKPALLGALALACVAAPALAGDPSASRCVASRCPKDFQGWLPGSGYRTVPAPSFECYSEAFDPANAIGNVDIWIPIKA